MKSMRQRRGAEMKTAFHKPLEPVPGFGPRPSSGAFQQPEQHYRALHRAPQATEGCRATVDSFPLSAVLLRGTLWLLLTTSMAFPSAGATLLDKPTTPADFSTFSDLTMLQCGNLVYAGSQSSVCFADKFLSDVAAQTNLRVNKKFCPVRLDSAELFDFPFCVMSGNERFTLSEKERVQLRKYLTQGGFLLVSPGCSDADWDKSFRQAIKLCFPEYSLQKIPMSHPVFSTVHKITRITEKHGKAAMLEGLEINGRLVLVYSREGLNDVENAKGCCCCGGNELRNPRVINLNVFTYAVLY